MPHRRVWKIVMVNRLAVLGLMVALIAVTPISSKDGKRLYFEELYKREQDSAMYYKQRTLENWRLMQIRLMKDTTKHTKH